MAFINSQLKQKIISSHDLEIGRLHFLENMVISEIREGKHLSFKSGNSYLKLISDFYGKQKPYGFISNRVNTFSIEALDFPKFTTILTNLKVYAAIGYTHFDKMNMDIEKQFCKVHYRDFDTIKESYNYINGYLKQKLCI